MWRHVSDHPSLLPPHPAAQSHRTPSPQLVPRPRDHAGPAGLHQGGRHVERGCVAGRTRWGAWEAGSRLSHARAACNPRYQLPLHTVRRLHTGGGAAPAAAVCGLRLHEPTGADRGGEKRAEGRGRGPVRRSSSTPHTHRRSEPSILPTDASQTLGSPSAEDIAFVRSDKARAFMARHVRSTQRGGPVAGRGLPATAAHCASSAAAVRRADPPPPRKHTHTRPPRACRRASPRCRGARC